MLKKIAINLGIYLGFLPEPQIKTFKRKSFDENPPIPMDEQTLREMKAAKKEAEKIKRKNFITNVIEGCDRHAAIKARQTKETGVPQRRTPIHSTIMNVEKAIGWGEYANLPQ